MRLWKVVKIAGWVVAALVVALAAAAFWLVRRAWPETSGEIAVAGLAAPVSVVRVPPGVPHIYAESAHDLFFAEGYVHAQDRLWQMELDRRAGDGELSALFGAATLDADRALRVLGIRRAAERDWAVLSPAGRAALDAYAQGVNAFLATHRGRLPVELALLRDDPRPWTPVDSLTWGKLMALNLSLNMPFEIFRAQAAARLGERAARQILAPYPADGPVIVPGTGGVQPAAGPPSARASGLSWPRDPAVEPGLARLARLAALGGLRDGAMSETWGSNAWVVGGAMTATGRPLLANDTHLGLQMPSVWYQIGLHGGGIDAVGFSFPGMPGVVLGHNRRIAWGITNSCADVQDLYEERIDGGRYLTAAGWRELAVRRESIAVAGGKPVALAVRETAHGPIVNDAVPELKGAPPMALRWTALGGTPLVDGLLALDRAGDWAAFRRALSLWDVPSLDVLYADVDGNIGYQMTGKVPLRAPGHTGLVPAEGWTGAAEWRGFIPYEALPSVENPPQGFLVAANHRVAGAAYPYFLADDMADPYRARRIIDRLAGRRGLTVRDMRDLQADTYGLPAAALRPYLLAVKPGSDLERQAQESVRAWDLRYEPDAVGATVFEVWTWYLVGDVLGDELGKGLLEQYRTVGLSQVPAIAALMAHPDDPLFDDRRTPRVERRDDIVRRSLGRAVAALRRRYGADPRTWTYGRLHAVTFVHQPLGGAGIAPLEWIFNSATLPARGTAFTVDAAVADPVHPFARFAVNFGSSERAIYDLAALDRSRWVNSTGQTAIPFHPHREDQTGPWEAVRLYPMIGEKCRVEAAAEGTLTLRPR